MFIMTGKTCRLITLLAVLLLTGCSAFAGQPVAPAEPGATRLRIAEAYVQSAGSAYANLPDFGDLG